MEHTPRRFDRVQDIAIRALLGLVLAVPYRYRIPLMGRLCSSVIAPIAGWRRRIRSNLAHACPDLPPAEVRRLQRAVPDNVGRTLIEIYSGAEFKAHVAGTPLSGPGLEPLRDAREAGRPVVLVTAHLGNFDALRAALFHQGVPLAALYREMNNPHFNVHYVAALSAIGTPLFPNKRRGVTQFVRHIADGGAVGILTDVYSRKGADVTFFGQSAPTSVAACDWALKYNALVIPCYGIRKPDGLSFDIRLEAPVEHSDPVTMTQAINDNLELQVRQHMEQWFWVHRRWKPERRRKGATRDRRSA
ncbi:KDO2-lipid IV(A) lauroyltransferase [Palleronia aestuarii]|uniref:KDO2-lipid IV(A) lauroyltransferase n=1 Tax=Palleronia aestuarii TaxID=568105 RepID=A0A2W7ND88_9RHOB|nr:lysophospholipid acyltransferase family protein [Palleronia aestuarii]PZX17583.1 KDO2-lipid IV(A) lauroyltransferase [Palleronia aestuarii]